MTPDLRDPRESRMSSKNLQFAVFTILERMWPSPNQPRSIPSAACSPGGGLQEPQEGLEELIFGEISMIWVQAGYFGRGETLGGLFWPRKNRAGAILAVEKPCVRPHSGNLTHTHTHTDSVFLIHRKLSEEQFCEARIP